MARIWISNYVWNTNVSRGILNPFKFVLASQLRFQRVDDTPIGKSPVNPWATVGLSGYYRTVRHGPFAVDRPTLLTSLSPIWTYSWFKY